MARCETPFGVVLLYHHVPGKPWREDPGPVARTLARLHRMAPPPGLTPAPDGSAALAAQTLSILALCAGPDADRLRAAAPRGAVPASGATALLHGDPVPGNLILSGGRLTLIDWQCPALGDPVHDLALFLSPAMQQIYRGAPLSVAETARFHTAYADPATTDRYRALAPWFHWRMAAYCLWRAKTGPADYTTGVALERACLSNT